MNKNWYQSKTIWGAIIAILGALLPQINSNLVLTSSDQATLVNSLGDIATLVGGLVAVWGRTKVQS